MTKELRDKLKSTLDYVWNSSPHNKDNNIENAIVSLEQDIKEAERRGIATCINLIPEEKEIIPLWGDAKYYAWYNAWLQLTRDNFDKYFSSLK